MRIICKWFGNRLTNLQFRVIDLSFNKDDPPRDHLRPTPHLRPGCPRTQPRCPPRRRRMRLPWPPPLPLQWCHAWRLLCVINDSENDENYKRTNRKETRDLTWKTFPTREGKTTGASQQATSLWSESGYKHQRRWLTRSRMNQSPMKNPNEFKWPVPYLSLRRASATLRQKLACLFAMNLDHQSALCPSSWPRPSQISAPSAPRRGHRRRRLSTVVGHWVVGALLLGWSVFF
jgi:hypothetical protein